MKDYELRILIEELQKLVVEKTQKINAQGFEIDCLRKDIELLRATIEKLEPKSPAA